MGGKEKVLEVLKDKELTAKEIKKDLEKGDTTSYNIQVIRNYLMKLQIHGLVEKVNEKREFVYRSMVNKILKFFIKIDKIATIPKEIKFDTYAIIIGLLPSYLKNQLNEVLSEKAQRFIRYSQKSDTYHI